MGAETTAFAGIGDEVVMSTIVTPRPGKAMRKDAAFEIFAKGLADTGLGCVVVTLAVGLACADEFMPSLGMVGYGLV